ncbi:MAG: hypothetical protein K2N94_08085 [Lachnospiraceae bacterium]|nr:hypothetical protein [Lachnospiraceae bacterium]
MRKFASKKVLAVSLATAMAVSMVGCGDKGNSEQDPSSTPVPTQGTSGDDKKDATPVPTQAPSTGDETTPTNAPDETTPGAEVTPDPVADLGELTGVAGNYTWKAAVGTLASYWNPHDYQTETDSYPLDYIMSGLYEFIYNDALNPVEGKDPYMGYVIRPEMAAEMPVDVTEEVKTAHPEFGIPASATAGYAYRIALNPNARWEDGTPINADTYVYSMRALLDPKMKNYRASDYMDGNFAIANAKNYYYQGTDIYTNGKTAQEWLDEGVSQADILVDMSFWGISAADGSQYGSAADDTMIRDPAIPEGEDEDYVSAKYIYETYLGPNGPYAGSGYDSQYLYVITGTWDENYPVENVGIFKNGDYEITIVLNKALAGFNLLYSLSGNWIVYEPYYEACKSKIGDTDAWSTTYCTSVETTMSYGPYKMVAFQSDKSMRFERNENWYGYSDGKHVYQDPTDGQIYPMYQTTAIDTQVVAEASTSKLMFLKGYLMGYGLQADDFTEYRNSEYCYATPRASTYFFIFNGYLEVIKNREAAEDFDKTKYDLETLTLQSFRKAVAVTYDKEALCTAINPSRSGGYGLIGTTYIYDPETGARYRDTPQAKRALCDFYSVDVSKFASLDEAAASITGYDAVAAKALYTQAFNEALEKGYITDADNDGISDQTLRITYSASVVDSFITKTLDYLNEKMNEVTAGTPFEGKVVFEASAPLGDPGWSDNIKAGLTDTVLSGWNGSLLNPFSLTELYTDPLRQYDAKWFDSTGVSLELELNTASIGAPAQVEKVTMNLQQWSKALQGDTIQVGGKAYNFGEGIADVDTRLEILSQIERAVLNTYDYIPMIQDGSMALLSQQVYYVIEEYNPILGRGGIAYTKYNYDDAEWADYVKSQGGELRY